MILMWPGRTSRPARSRSRTRSAGTRSAQVTGGSTSGRGAVALAVPPRARGMPQATHAINHHARSHAAISPHGYTRLRCPGGPDAQLNEPCGTVSDTDGR
jgi:hypothetical protein